MLLQDIFDARDILIDFLGGENTAKPVAAEQEQVVLVNLERTLNFWICLFRRVTEAAGDNVVVGMYEGLLLAQMEDFHHVGVVVGERLQSHIGRVAVESAVSAPRIIGRVVGQNPQQYHGSAHAFLLLVFGSGFLDGVISGHNGLAKKFPNGVVGQLHILQTLFAKAFGEYGHGYMGGHLAGVHTSHTVGHDQKTAFIPQRDHFGEACDISEMVHCGGFAAYRRHDEAVVLVRAVAGCSVALGGNG